MIMTCSTLEFAEHPTSFLSAQVPEVQDLYDLKIDEKQRGALRRWRLRGSISISKRCRGGSLHSATSIPPAKSLHAFTKSKDYKVALLS